MSNRYSQYTASQFNPLSLEEIMAVPLYKQGQYDKAQEDLSVAQQSLQLDPYTKHSERAKELQYEMDNKFNDVSKQLATTGDFTGMKNNILNLKREYDKLMSPMGEAAQINAVNKAIKAESANYIAQATAMKHHPDRVKENLDAIIKKYNEDDMYDENGNIKQFTIDELPPVYVDGIEEFKKISKDVGRDVISTATEIVGTDAYGNYIKKDGTTVDQNIPGLKALVNYFNNVVDNPNSDLYKSNVYNKISKEDMMSEINDLFPVYKDYKKNTVEDINYFGNNNTSSSNSSSDTVPQSDVMYENVQEDAGTILEGYTYSEAQKKYKELLKSNDPKDIEQGKIMQQQLADVNQELEDNEEYVRLKNAVDKNKNELLSLNPPENIKEYFKQDDIILHPDTILYDINKKLGLNPNQEDADFLHKNRLKVWEIFGNMSNNYNELKDIKNKTIESYKQPIVGYVIPKTEQTETKWKQTVDQLALHLQEGINSDNSYVMDSVYFTNSDGKYEKVSAKDNGGLTKNVIDAFARSGNRDIKQSIIKGEDGYPMIEFTFVPEEKVEIDGKGSWYEFDPTTKGQISFRIGLPNLGKGMNLKPIDDLFIKYMEDLGGETGKQIANDMRDVSKYKNIQVSYDKADYKYSNEIKQHATALKDFEDIDLKYKPARRSTGEKAGYFYVIKSNMKKGGIMIEEDIPFTWSSAVGGSITNLKHIPDGMLDEFTSGLLNYMYKHNMSVDSMNNYSDADLDKLYIDYFNSIKNQPITFSSKENALRSMKAKK